MYPTSGQSEQSQASPDSVGGHRLHILSRGVTSLRLSGGWWRSLKTVSHSIRCKSYLDPAMVGGTARGHVPTLSEMQSYFSNRETTNCIGLLEETNNTHGVHIGGRRLVTVRKNHLVLSSKWRWGSSPYSLGQLQSSPSGSDQPEKGGPEVPKGL